MFRPGYGFAMTTLYFETIKVYATVYVRAKTEAEAKAKIASIDNTVIQVQDAGGSEIEISDAPLANLPDISLSPAMTIAIDEPDQIEVYEDISMTQPKFRPSDRAFSLEHGVVTLEPSGVEGLPLTDGHRTYTEDGRFYPSQELLAKDLMTLNEAEAWLQERLDSIRARDWTPLEAARELLARNTLPTLVEGYRRGDYDQDTETQTLIGVLKTLTQDQINDLVNRKVA